MLQIKLTPLDQRDVRGIYTINGEKGKMPRSTCYLEPEAAQSVLRGSMLKHVVFSDILRTPESSLRAVQAGRGAKAPGYSGHNFGLSIDIDIKATMKNTGLKTKKDLDNWFEGYGWYCHRTDHKLDFEAWHMNFLGDVSVGRVKTTAGLLEVKIRALYGAQLGPPEPLVVQTLLSRLGLYGGDLDGLLGPRSQAALAAFQRAWALPPSGKLDSKTARTLLFVAREIQIVNA